MKLVWIGTPADPEFDITAALAKSKNIDMHWYIMLDPADKHNDFHLDQITRADNINMEIFAPKQTGAVLSALFKMKSDLIIVKHPSWIRVLAKNRYVELLNSIPIVCWTWEWIPNMVLNDMPQLEWPRIAMSNTPDLWRCQAAFPNKQALYLPFGTYKQPDYQPQEQWKSDLIADAQPHSACGCFKGIKKQSVDTMVRPVLDKDIALWGSRYGTKTKHDWLWEPEYASKVRGTYTTRDYPAVYKSAKIYLGVTWNWATGGYSTRLARALMSGIMVIWHKTLGSELDINPKEKIMEWSDSPERTRELVDYYLSHEEERQKVALAGQKWALEHWGWEKALLRLAEEVQCPLK